MATEWFNQQSIQVKTSQFVEWEFCSAFVRPPKNPLFYLDLTIDQIGPRYITSYESFPNIILGAFDRAITQTQAIPQIEKVRVIQRRFSDDHRTFV